jgi:hypothetical protein
MNQIRADQSSLKVIECSRCQTFLQKMPSANEVMTDGTKALSVLKC